MHRHKKNTYYYMHIYIACSGGIPNNNDDDSVPDHRYNMVSQKLRVGDTY